MTAVEWLVNEIKSFGIDTKFINNAIEQAKEMEKDQICWAYSDGQHKDKKEFPTKYYNETYGSKGSDKTKTDNI